jgi:hypothetical protein
MGLKIALSWDAEQEIITSSASFRKSRLPFFRERHSSEKYHRMNREIQLDLPRSGP